MIDRVLCMHAGIPQWRNAGNWGLLTWDHRLPGVIIGSNMYVLKLSWDYASYPSSGTAEIRVRNYGDRDNHTFVTYAKLNQIAADGNLSQDAYIFTDGQSLYYTATVTWYRETGPDYRFTPTKVVLYRLDSVDSSSVGVFTLLGTSTMTANLVANTGWVKNNHPDLSWTDNGYYTRYSNIDKMFNETLATTEVLTYTDNYGTFNAAAKQLGTAEYFITPYMTNLQSRKVRAIENFSGRAFKTVAGGSPTKLINPYQTMEWEGIANSGFTGYEPTGTDWSFASRPIFNGNWPRVWVNGSAGNPQGLSLPHPVSFSNNWNTDYAEAWGIIDIMTEWNISLGSGTSLVTRSYILNHRDSRLDILDMPTYTPSAYSTTYDSMVGLWGSINAAIWLKARVIYDANSLHSGSRGVDYTDFYVIKGSDTSNTSRYSIFSGVEDGGEILHIEGLEDPTPTLWLDNTFVGNLN